MKFEVSSSKVLISKIDKPKLDFPKIYFVRIYGHHELLILEISLWNTYPVQK